MEWIPHQPPDHVLAKEGQKPRRVFVDIGSGTFPAAFSGNRSFNDNDYYVGVDSRRREIDRSISEDYPTKNTENVGRLGENIFFLEHNIHVGKLPFADSSVDEVILANVLGDDSIIQYRYFLREAYRILKSGGTFVVIETVTPQAARYLNYELNSNEAMYDLFKQTDFEVIKEIKPTDPDFNAELSKYNQHYFRHIEGKEFIIYLRKK